jgi:hypothetical protein
VPVLRSGLTRSASITLLVLACSPAVSPVPSAFELETPGQTTPSIDVSCTPDSEAPGYLGDPCPEAITAVELAVAPVRLPITGVVIEPGPFFCDDVWPGAGSDPPCYGPMVRPGQFMHAWVSFERSQRVAAVALGRDFPIEPGSPQPSAPPWNATLVTVEVPPADWSAPTSRLVPT